MPSRKEIQWSQLKVGSLVLAAMAVLIGLVFLMNGTGGGPFGRKIVDISTPVSCISSPGKVLRVASN